MNVFKLFPTTVMEFDLGEYSKKNQILEYINNSPTKNHTLISKGNSSHNKDQFLQNPQFTDLKYKMEECLNKFSHNFKSPPLYIKNSWFNIMFKGGKLEPHHHGDCIVAGAYYPFIKENTCNLRFKSPLYSSVTYVNLPDTDNFYKTFTMNIKPNHLYLFPGWLEHYTEDNMEEKRIVISFNAYY